MARKPIRVVLARNYRHGRDECIDLGISYHTGTVIVTPRNVDRTLRGLTDIEIIECPLWRSGWSLDALTTLRGHLRLIEAKSGAAG